CMTETHDTSCSADAPPNSTTSRVRAMAGEGSGACHYHGREASAASGPAGLAGVAWPAGGGSGSRSPGGAVSFSVHDGAAAVDGSVHGDGGIVVEGAAVDSRLISGGELFVPLVAERDGHAFIEGAIDDGA